MKRTYIKCVIWHLGGRKGQIGVFFAYSWHTSQTLIGIYSWGYWRESFKGTVKKIEGKEDLEGMEEENGNGFSMPRNNILLQRLANPKLHATTQWLDVLCKIRKDSQTCAGTHLPKNKRNTCQKNWAQTTKKEKDQFKKQAEKERIVWCRTWPIYVYILGKKGCRL